MTAILHLFSGFAFTSNESEPASNVSLFTDYLQLYLVYLLPYTILLLLIFWILNRFINKLFVNVLKINLSKPLRLLIALTLLAILIWCAFLIPRAIKSITYSSINNGRKSSVDYDVYELQNSFKDYFLVGNGLTGINPLKENPVVYRSSYVTGNDKNPAELSGLHGFKITEGLNIAEAVDNENCKISRDFEVSLARGTYTSGYTGKCQKIITPETNEWYKISSEKNDDFSRYFAFRNIGSTSIIISYFEQSQLSDEDMSKIFDSLEKINLEKFTFKYGIPCAFPTPFPNCTGEIFNIE